MDVALEEETDLPMKEIPPLLEVPKGWREEHSGGANCFYFARKAGFDGNWSICHKNFDAINLAWFDNPTQTKGHAICGGSCWAEYTGISEHCKLCKAWEEYVERLKSCTRRG